MNPKNDNITTNLTELETAIMKALPLDPTYEDGFESTILTDSLLDTVSVTSDYSARSARGPLTTLKRKGYLLNVGTNMLAIGEIGREWMIAAGIVTPAEGRPIPKSRSKKKNA